MTIFKKILMLILGISCLILSGYSKHVNTGKNNINKHWQILGQAGFSAGGANDISFAIDTTGVPYVAYQDLVNSNKATVMKFDGESWVNVG